MSNDAAIRTHIVLYGKDRELLRIRALLIKSAGYEPYIAEDLACLFQCLCLDNALVLVILCHTTPADERHDIFHAIRSNHAKLGTYCLLSSVPPGLFLTEVDRLINTGASDCSA